MHLLGNQLLYSLMIDTCRAGKQLIYMLREGMLEVADTLQVLDLILIETSIISYHCRCLHTW